MHVWLIMFVRGWLHAYVCVCVVCVCVFMAAYECDCPSLLMSFTICQTVSCIASPGPACAEHAGAIQLQLGECEAATGYPSGLGCDKEGWFISDFKNQGTWVRQQPHPHPRLCPAHTHAWNSTSSSSIAAASLTCLFQ